MTNWKPYPEITVQAGNVEGLYRLQTVSGRVIIAGHFHDEGEAERFALCWNACRKIERPDNHIPATEDYVKRLEGLRKEAWARVQELEGGIAPAPAGWSFDITTAPRGRTVKTERQTKDGIRTVESFEPDIILLASACGKVLRSYWVPATNHHDGYWAGFAQKDATPPVAWMAWPVHPNAVSDLGLNIVTKQTEVAA